MRRLEWSPELLEPSLAFCAAAPVGHIDRTLRARLLTKMTSAPDGAIVLSDARGLALVGTVIDVIADPEAPARLVVLGARDDLEVAPFMEAVGLASSFAARGPRKALAVEAPTFIDGSGGALVRAGFAPTYDSFFMRRSSGAPPAGAAPELPPGWRWTALDEALVAPLHEALTEIFRGDFGTTLPPLDAFRSGALGIVAGWRVLLDGAAVAGAVRLAVDGREGEVRVLGRHPSHRGRGLGRVILDHGLRVLADFSVDAVTLEVTATNENALALYRSYDFEVVTRVSHYARRCER
jgi:ribosomal protein S18 acetylase RimI-like enzyme